MTSADEQLNSARHVARFLVLSADAVKEDFSRAVEPFGIPTALARALLVLDKPTSMREVAQQLACDPSYITGIADQLEQLGLIARTTGTDRRVKLLTTTATGASIRERMATAVAETSPTQRHLSGAQRTTLVEILDQLLTARRADDRAADNREIDSRTRRCLHVFYRLCNQPATFAPVEGAYKDDRGVVGLSRMLNCRDLRHGRHQDVAPKRLE